MSNWFNGIDGRAVNRQFFAKLAEGGAAIQDLGMAVSTFIKDRLRENGIFRRLLLVEYVHPDDLDRDENVPETFKKIVELEPDAGALAVTIRGDSDGVYVRGKVVALHFGRISTPRFEKSVDELMYYESPITKLIEENSVKDVQEIEDYKGFAAIEQAVYSSANGTHRVHFKDTFPTSVGLQSQVTREAIGFTAALLAANERRATTIVMSQSDVMKFAATGDGAIIGSDLASKVTIEGWQYADLFGMRLLASTKSVSRQGRTFTAGTVGNGDQIALTRQGLAPLDENRFFVFDDADRLGKFYSLEEANFHIKQEFNLVQWMLTEMIAMGIVNTGSMAVCDLRLVSPDTGTWLPSLNTPGGSDVAYDTALIA